MADLSSVDEFLNQCKQSGDAAYGALRSVLERLEDPNTRSKARIFLSDIYKRVGSSETSLQTYHFHIQDIYLDQYEGNIIDPILCCSSFTILENCSVIICQMDLIQLIILIW